MTLLGNKKISITSPLPIALFLFYIFLNIFTIAGFAQTTTGYQISGYCYLQPYEM